MANLCCPFPSSSCSSHRLCTFRLSNIKFQLQQQCLQLRLGTHRFSPPRDLSVSASASSSSDDDSRVSKKVKVRKPVKSNEELCNDLLEFVSMAGLPQGHVPSFKDLNQHGRKDLANIVRRRGYKLITELLTVSTSAREHREDSINACENALLDKEENELAEGIASSSEASATRSDSLDANGALSLTYDAQSCMESSTSSSLLEKAAKFIQDGELDVTEDIDYGNMSTAQAHGDGRCMELLNEIQYESHFNKETEHEASENHATSIVDASATTSELDAAAATDYYTERNGSSSSEGVDSDHSDEVLDAKANEKDDQVEVDHLKFMLHQKELELSQLKEQIEKEKLALSMLQAKAEKEIGKSQEIILAKDEELLAAEESLSGLKEVQIDFWGSCETVEVAGSFNGWHHQVKMDPQPSTATNAAASSKSKLWSTVLWLYPGIYEIKFIVDGHWRIDPQRESVTRGSIHNNILRVDR